MMIDVDPSFRRLNRGDGRPKSILNRGIERDRNIDIFRFGRRFRENFGARKKTVFVEHAVLVPDANIFPEFFEGESQSKLTSERVAVWTNMTENGKPLMLAQSPADLLE